MTAESNHQGLLSRSQCFPQQPLPARAAVTSSTIGTGSHTTRKFENHSPAVVIGTVVDTFRAFFLSMIHLPMGIVSANSGKLIPVYHNKW